MRRRERVTTTDGAVVVPEWVHASRISALERHRERAMGVTWEQQQERLEVAREWLAERDLSYVQVVLGWRIPEPNESITGTTKWVREVPVTKASG